MKNKRQSTIPINKKSYLTVLEQQNCKIIMKQVKVPHYT